MRIVHLLATTELISGEGPFDTCWQLVMIWSLCLARLAADGFSKHFPVQWRFKNKLHHHRNTPPRDTTAEPNSHLVAVNPYSVTAPIIIILGACAAAGGGGVVQSLGVIRMVLKQQQRRSTLGILSDHNQNRDTGATVTTTQGYNNGLLEIPLSTLRCIVPEIGKGKEW